MRTKSNPGRRQFLTSAFSATASSVAIGLYPSHSLAQQPSTGGSPLNTAASPGALYDTSTLATTLTGEAADRLALRKLVDAWCHCADRRLAEAQANLFVPDGVIINVADPVSHHPTTTLKGRAEIRKALAVLNTFAATTHFNGQSDILLDGDHATGETYCLAHQLIGEGAQRKLQVLSIRYLDKFLRQDHRWYFVERKLLIDWTDTRSSTP
jgi:hypothetical protein